MGRSWEFADQHLHIQYLLEKIQHFAGLVDSNNGLMGKGEGKGKRKKRREER